MNSMIVLFIAILATASLVNSQQNQDCYIDVAFVIDESGSIRDTNVAGQPDNWGLVIQFVKNVVMFLNVGPSSTHVAAVNFGNDARVDFNLSRWTTTNDVLAAIDQIQYEGGNTNMTGGLRVARRFVFSPEYGNRPDASDVLILLTDGVPTVEVDGLFPEVDSIKAMNITIIAVGITNAVNDTLLKAIVTPPPDENYLPVSDFNKLSSSIAKLINSSCQVTPPLPSSLITTGTTVTLSSIITTLSVTRTQQPALSSPGPGTVTTSTTAAVTGATAISSVTRTQQPALSSPGSSTITTSTTAVVTGATAISSVTRTQQPALSSPGPGTITTSTTAVVTGATAISSATTTTVSMLSASGATTTSMIEGLTLADVPNCPKAADIVIALDASGTKDDSNFDAMKSFVSDLVANLNIDQGVIRLGLVAFSDSADERFDLNTYHSRVDIQAAIATIPFSAGSRNTAACLNYIRTVLFTTSKGDRAGVQNIIVVLTNGGSNDKNRTLSEAGVTKMAGIHMIVIGVGSQLDLYELYAIASYPYSSNVLTANGFSDLSNLTAPLGNMICDNFDECSVRPCENSGTCQSSMTTYECNCSSPYSGVNCQQTCNTAADVVFILDGSGSIGAANFQKEVDFVTNLVLGLNNDCRVGLMMFSDTVSVRFYLNDFQSKASILDAISLYYVGGSSNTAAALMTVRTIMFTSSRGDRPNYANIGVIITNGRSNDPTATVKEAMLTRAQGITLIAVGIGPSPNLVELSGIASYPAARNVFNSTDFSSLNSIEDSLVQAICNNVNECISSPCLNDGSCTDLVDGFQCNCSSNSTGIRCERGCSARIDLCLVIDSSDSIGRDRFPKVIDFLVSILSELEIGPDKTQVGAVEFGETAAVEFQLQSYSNQQDVINALMRMVFTGGKTNIADALLLARTRIFNGSNGDREDAKNVVVLISDGNANVNAAYTIPNAIALRNSGAFVIAVGLGTLVNTVVMKAIVSRPTDRTIFTAMSWMNLSDIETSVIGTFCDDVNECSSGPSCQNGGSCVDGYWSRECKCLPDYTGQFCERRCVRSMDVVLILDISGSEEAYYDLVVEFAFQVIIGLPVDSGSARVGIISFSDNATVNIYLDSYTTKEQLINALAFQFDVGKTNTQAAIRLAYESVFNGARGDRSGVPNIAVVVTDGDSNVQPENTIPEANNARARNIELYAVAMGTDININEINGIASPNVTDHVVYVSNSTGVASAVLTLLDWLCQ